MSNIANDLYSGSADLGYIKSLIGLIVAIIIGVILLIFSYYFLSSSDNFVGVTWTVVSANCNQGTVSSNRTIKYNCNLIVSYTVNDKVYQNNLISSSSVFYNNGESITISYDKTNPNSIKLGAMSNTMIGSISIIFAIIIVLGSGINYYLTEHYKFYAAAQGAETAYSMFR